MIADFHFLRPWWLLMIIPLLLLVKILWQQNPKLYAWSDVCDSHLLDHLIQSKGHGKRMFSFSFLLFSIFFMILGISGPTWHKMPVPLFKAVQPRVLLLDMSDNMLSGDLSPNRLSRAKFKLRDLLAHKDVGQFGLIAFTSEPFVVSPLTDDGQTISALLSNLTPDVMPVEGYNLDSALKEASKLVKEAGYQQGQILVLTAEVPSKEAIEKANQLSKLGLISSIMPIRADSNLNPLFGQFATAGKGQLLKYSSDDSDLQQWLAATKGNEQFALNEEDDIPLWRDEGRWFLIPALLLLLPLFQRGWLQRVKL
ncbi:vWA domain-containing protein [Legionella waltersii]|uniref:VWFA domain-containing protein n=1 Tax=Legionella waltersii TaxID=66969 RepID=A0A0W1A4X1_9GAMM|nr:VWA domain-containing protein [Legionella waltersii]KTD76358.1 hypothetical protein Lwal_2080 [Legionella waltersii]SNV13931.1 TPR (repeat) domain protein [Legionella waltersii]